MITFHQGIQLNGKCLSSFGYNKSRSGNVLLNKLFQIDKAVRIESLTIYKLSLGRSEHARTVRNPNLWSLHMSFTFYMAMQLRQCFLSQLHVV